MNATDALLAALDAAEGTDRQVTYWDRDGVIDTDADSLTRALVAHGWTPPGEAEVIGVAEAKQDAEVTITVPTESGGHLTITFSDDCTAGDYQDVLKWLDRVPWTTPVADGDEDEDLPPCGCCTRTDGHEPWCVCVQPDEYVIDDHTPGVMRPATPDDYN